jgi:hypothetical protein
MTRLSEATKVQVAELQGLLESKRGGRYTIDMAVAHALGIAIREITRKR